MKQFISIICALTIFCVVLSGCNKNTESGGLVNSSNELNNSQEENQQVIDTREILKLDSNNSYKSLIKKSYKQTDLIKLLFYFGSDNCNTMLDYLNSKYPIECIRKFDNSLTYCIYKLNEGGLLYVYFHGKDLKFADCVFVVKESLSKEDFNDLKPGDSISKVEEIDKGTKLINSINSEYLRSETSFHMVKEGFMKINYTSDNYKPESYKIEKVEFVKNGDKLNEYNYYFLPGDYNF